MNFEFGRSLPHIKKFFSLASKNYGLNKLKYLGGGGCGGGDSWTLADGFARGDTDIIEIGLSGRDKVVVGIVVCAVVGALL